MPPPGLPDPGFIEAGSTPHFFFEFDEKLTAGSPAVRLVKRQAVQALSDALGDTCEEDLDTIVSWFDGLMPRSLPFVVQIGPVRPDRGGSNDQKRTITVDVGTAANLSHARSVLVAELIELFMPVQGGGWNALYSHGEGLSQAAQFELYPDQASTLLEGCRVWLDAIDIDAHPRRDWVSMTDPTDGNIFSYGCALLFIYYLRSQLGFNMRAIVQAAADTLEGVYKNLTRDSGGFGPFAALLQARFPVDKPSKLIGSTNPFPLPSDAVLSATQYVAGNPLGGQTFRELITSKNIGYFRALLNSDRPESLV